MDVLPLFSFFFRLGEVGSSVVEQIWDATTQLAGEFLGERNDTRGQY